MKIKQFKQKTSLTIMEFSKNGLSIIVKKDENEPDNFYYERYWFIISQNMNKYKNMEELIKLSKIWINIKYLKCKYSSSITRKVIKMSKFIE